MKEVFEIGNGQTCQTYDARGNGDGKTALTLTGDHESRVTDYTSLAVENKPKTIVRRLTPKECERLQGFPDDYTNIGEWTDTKGKKHKTSDAPRYKALGNSIALPFGNGSQREWSAFCEPKATMSRQWQVFLMV